MVGLCQSIPDMDTVLGTGHLWVTAAVGIHSNLDSMAEVDTLSSQEASTKDLMFIREQMLTSTREPLVAPTSM